MTQTLTHLSLLVPLLEAILLAAEAPLSLARISQLFDEAERPALDDLQTALLSLQSQCEGRGYELVEVASGWRLQVRKTYAPWVNRLWEEKPQRYSRALLETLALIAYQQPITRGDIEDIRGVTVSSTLIKTLLDRNWVKVVGQREVPGRPALYATTAQFLDYFNLKSLSELPPLSELTNLSPTLEAALTLEPPPAPVSAQEQPHTADSALTPA